MASTCATRQKPPVIDVCRPVGWCSCMPYNNIKMQAISAAVMQLPYTTWSHLIQARIYSSDRLRRR
eukprot:6176035-Pleurochrysis_carterae.AAC.4